MNIKLDDSRLFVKDETSNVYEVEIGKINDEGILYLYLTPIEKCKKGGAVDDTFSVDILNESIYHAINKNGYIAI